MIAETKRARKYLREGIKDHIQNTLNFRENTELDESAWEQRRGHNPKKKFRVKTPKMKKVVFAKNYLHHPTIRNINEAIESKQLLGGKIIQ